MATQVLFMLNTHKRSCLRPTLFFTSVLLLVAWSTQQSNAFEGLNEAQSWIYDRSHLSNTTAGQTLDYSYKGEDSSSVEINDRASLSIVSKHDDDTRDVEISFLTGERHLPLPPFSGYRGNPVIIAMLEHIAQTMSAQSGGGALYFRNRIRDSLAGSDVVLESHNIRYADKEYSGTRITFHPFLNDEYLGIDNVLRQSRFSIELSDEIPGGVFSVQVLATGNSDVFERSLSLM